MVTKTLSIAILVTTAFLGQPTAAVAQQEPRFAQGFSTARTTNEPQRSAVSVGELFRAFGTDLVHLPSRETFTTLLVGGGLTGAASTQDREFADYARGAHSLEEALDAGSWTGGGALQMGGAFATFVIGRAAHKPRVVHLGSDLVRAQVLNAILTQGIKLAAQRTRPDGSNLSFPSGHTSATFASAVVLQRHFGWKIGLPAYGVASYVGLSRITDKRHYLSDVLFGATIGIVAGRTVTIGHGRHQFALAPLSLPRGAGVQFVKISISSVSRP